MITTLTTLVDYVLLELNSRIYDGFQVLVSIQSLILVNEPYFNEPGMEMEKGTPEGDQASRLYNESARVLTLQIMLHMLKEPVLRSNPIVREHYKSHADRILASCQEQSSASSNSPGFKSSILRLIPELSRAFDNIQ